MVLGRYEKYRSIIRGNPFTRSKSSPLFDTPEWQIYSTFEYQHAYSDEPESNWRHCLPVSTLIMESDHGMPKIHASTKSDDSGHSSLCDLEYKHQRSTSDQDPQHQESQSHTHRNGPLTKSLVETGWSKPQSQSLSRKSSIRRRPLPVSLCLQTSEDSASSKA